MKLSDNKYLRYQNKWIYPNIRLLLKGIDVVSWLAAVGLLVAVVYRYGFDLSDTELEAVQGTYHVVWIVFMVRILAHMLLRFSNTRQQTGTFTWTVRALYLLTLVPVIFYRPADGPVLQFWLLTDSQTFRLVLMLTMSLMLLANSFVAVLGRKVNPSMILAISFLMIILVGAGLLLLPRCTIGGLGWMDAIFLSTSAVCVTGLTPIDISSTLTDTGMLVLTLLFQVGGLGVMTFTSFFAMFFMGNTSIYNLMMVKDMMSSSSLNSLLSLLLYILGFTVCIEAIGAFAIWTDIHGTLGMTMPGEMLFAIFHSISAFCNAGFSTMPGGLSNPVIATQHTPFFLYLSVLIVLGGLGFPILVNFKDNIASFLHRVWQFARTRHWQHRRYFRRFSLNTSIVVIVSALLIAIGTAAFAALEWDNTLAGLGSWQKGAQALFMSVCARSAGFLTFDPSTWTTGSLVIFAMLMAIGGGSQSTAGGIKINAFAVTVMEVVSLLRGNDRVEVFGREISRSSIRRSAATVLLFMAVLMVSVLALSLIEPQLPLRHVAMECTAALSTGGVSLGATPLLHDGGKALVTLLMFTGRLGLLTVFMGIRPPRQQHKFRYPSGEIIIN